MCGGGAPFGGAAGDSQLRARASTPPAAGRGAATAAAPGHGAAGDAKGAACIIGDIIGAGCGGGVQVVSPVCTWYQYGRPSAAVALCQSPAFGGAAPYGAGSAAAGLTKPGWRALCCRSNWYSTSGLSTRCCATHSPLGALGWRTR